MKTFLYKTRCIWITALAIVMGLLIITTTYAKDTCIEISQRTYDRVIRWGYQARIVEGYTDENKLHQWVEWFNPKRNLWCVWDEAIWYIGKSWHTSEEIGYTEISIIKIRLRGN